MKKLFYLLVPAMFFFACNNSDTKKEEDSCCEKDKKECCDKEACKDMITVDSLLANLETFVNKDVKVCGKCIHVCEHSGKNIFIANPENDTIMIVGKAGEGIEKFDKALLDKHVMVIGVLKSVEVENEEAEVHHDIAVEYYIEVKEAKECKCTTDKDGKCCGDNKEHKGCGQHKEGGCGGH
jgi:hypothetical protein